MKTYAAWGVLACLVLAMSGCSTPSVVRLPARSTMVERQIVNFEPEQLPVPVLRVYPGDTIRIVRDAQTPAEKDEMILFAVRTDGNIAYPFVGTVKAAGRTPEDIGAEISRRLASIYREPHVTVNIAEAPGNRVYVGGAVRNPGAFNLNSGVTVAQAITATGGVLPTADSRHVALVREDGQGVQQVYFFDYSTILSPKRNGTKAVMLQRGDLVFVPTSKIGNAVQGVDLYLGQLLMFRGIGAGVNYQLNNSEPRYNVNYPNGASQQ